METKFTARKMTPGRKRCACCGEDAGRWMQWHNQDTGYGICRSCVDMIMTRLQFGRVPPEAEPLEFCRIYGLPGKNYEPKTIEAAGRRFNIVAQYPDTDEGARLANEFMRHFDSTGVLCVRDGVVTIAAMDDVGIDVDDEPETLLPPLETWQTQARGTNDDEYQIYAASAQALGWKIKSYDEWLRT